MEDTATKTLKPGKLQRFLWVWFLLAVLWIIVGKSLFGVVGWITVIMLFTVAPFLAIYGFVLWIITRFRHKRSGYVMSRALCALVIALLVNLFVFGLVVVDGGDTRESGQSVLTSLYGINLANGADHPLMKFSESLTGKSIVLSLLLAPAILGMSFIEKRATSSIKSNKEHVE